MYMLTISPFLFHKSIISSISRHCPLMIRLIFLIIIDIVLQTVPLLAVSEIISAIFQIYRHNLNYIGDFQNISAQLELYQRFFEYIDLPTKTDKIKRSCPDSEQLLSSYANSSSKIFSLSSVYFTKPSLYDFGSFGLAKCVIAPVFG